MTTDKPHPFIMLTMTALFLVLFGHLLYIGQNLLLPILTAVIVVYVLVSTSAWLGRLPFLCHCSESFRRILVLIFFAMLLAMLGEIVVDTAAKLGPGLPTYQENLSKLFHSVTTHFNMIHMPDLSGLWEKMTTDINLQKLVTGILGGLSSLAGWLFLVIIYAGFMIAERGSFANKIKAAFPDGRGQHIAAMVHNLNRSIGEYLTVKTLINACLGAICFIILLVFGVDFAIFWAIIIALFNYIPYVGAFVGVSFPVLLALAQYGSLSRATLLLAVLAATQAFVGNVVEPKMIGKKVNMSPFVVMVALTLWSSLWGIAGAILAIPLTSMIAIILAYFDTTRPIAILLAEDVHALYQQNSHQRQI